MDLAVNINTRKPRVFVLDGADFRGPDEKFARGLGLKLNRRGHRVLIAIRGNEKGIRAEVSGELPNALEIVSYGYFGPWVDRNAVARARAFEPDIVQVFGPEKPCCPRPSPKLRVRGGER